MRQNALANNWKAASARRVLAGLLKIGLTINRHSGSHRTLEREGWPNYVFAFHDNDESTPIMLSGFAKQTGLTPEGI